MRVLAAWDGSPGVGQGAHASPTVPSGSLSTPRKPSALVVVGVWGWGMTMPGGTEGS